MNELMIVIEGMQWIYFRTEQKTADKAFQEFNETCDSIGLNHDNVAFIKAVLRDKEGNDVDQVTFIKSEVDR